MKKNMWKFGQIGCVVFMVIVLVLQFLPYWEFDGQGTSIASFVWRPYLHDDLISGLSEQTGAEVNLNSEVGAPILMLVLGVAGAALVFVKSDWPLAAFAGVCFGATGIFGYLNSAVLRAGNMWWLHMVLCAAALALGVLGCVECLATDGKNRRKA